MSEKELCIEKLQKALLKLPKDDLVKLLKNTYQAMKIKHNIPNPQNTNKSTQNHLKPESKLNKSNSIKENSLNKNTRRNTKLSNQNLNFKNPQPNHSQSNANTIDNSMDKVNTMDRVKGSVLTNKLNHTVNTVNTTVNTVTTVNNLVNNVNNVNKVNKVNNMNDMEEGTDETVDTMDMEEEITFRSQEFQVQVPELDLTLAHEYINSKHSKNLLKDEEKTILTPKFSFNPKNTVDLGNSHTTNINPMVSVGRMNSSNIHSFNTNNSVNSVNTMNNVNPKINVYNGMNVQYLKGYGGNGVVWSGGPVNFPCLRPVQIIRRPFYPRSRSLQRGRVRIWRSLVYEGVGGGPKIRMGKK